jgi:hypothetical protein
MKKRYRHKKKPMWPDLATWASSSIRRYSTVTDFARLRGLSTSVPRASAV